MSSLHVGKAGQLATMAEFLLRGYNTAMPEVDVGDDIFVVHDWKEQFWRIQVKTALAKTRGYGCSGRIAVDLQQLTSPKRPDLTYVFAIRHLDRWEFLVIPRPTLRTEWETHGVGAVVQQKLVLHLSVRAAEVLCSDRHWQPLRNNWTTWPVIVR